MNRLLNGQMNLHANIMILVVLSIVHYDHTFLSIQYRCTIQSNNTRDHRSVGPVRIVRTFHVPMRRSADCCFVFFLLPATSFNDQSFKHALHCSKLQAPTEADYCCQCKVKSHEEFIAALTLQTVSSSACSVLVNLHKLTVLHIHCTLLL